MSGICDKSQKIGPNSNSENRIFGNDHQLKRHEFVIAQKKDGEYKTETSVSRGIQEQQLKILGSLDLNNAIYPSCQSTAKISATKKFV